MSIQTQLNRINQGVANQAAIMEQIKGALQGKGSSGGSGNTYANVGITTPNIYTPTVCYVGENGAINTTGTGTYKCLVPSIMYVFIAGSLSQYYTSGDVTMLTEIDNHLGIALIFNIAGAGNITYQAGGGSN